MKWGGHGALELFPVLVWLMLIDSAISPAAISVTIGTGLEQSDRHRIVSMKLTLSILKIISGDFWNLVGGILRNALFFIDITVDKYYDADDNNDDSHITWEI